jgi:hypothetical protein
VNIGFLDQNRVVLHADNQILVLLDGLPEGIASLEDTGRWRLRSTLSNVCDLKAWNRGDVVAQGPCCGPAAIPDLFRALAKQERQGQ